MDVTMRTFYGLLQASMSGVPVDIEPLSAFKWRKVMHMSMLHGVEAEAFAGMEVLEDQFFVQQIPAYLRSQWAEQAARRREAPMAPLPVTGHLEKRLALMAESAGASSPEFTLLHTMAGVAQALLADGGWLRGLLLLADQMQTIDAPADAEQLRHWIGQLRLSKMVGFERMLLEQLLKVDPAVVSPYMPNAAGTRSLMEYVATSVPRGQERMRFSQDKDIFVHTSNASAMLRNARRAAWFLRYYPLGSIRQLVASFARSLADIEE